MNNHKYVYSHIIEIEIIDSLEEKLQKAVYDIRNSDLDNDLKVDIDGLDQIAFEIDDELNEYPAEEIKTVEYTRINKDTNENEIVQLNVEVFEIEKDFHYGVAVKSIKKWNESI